MQKILTNAQMRNADKYTIETLKIPSLTLMERAGEEVVKEITKQFFPTQKVLVVCGGGNNGGDGFVIARLLKEQGYAVTAFCCAKNFSNDCLVNKEKFSGEVATTFPSEKFDLIVDCLFGTGLTRDITGTEAEVVTKINESSAYVLSVDIPSGLNGDNGKIMGCSVQANETVAIGEIKCGHVLNDGLDVCGKVVVVDIGIKVPAMSEANLLESKDISDLFAKRKRNSNKGTYGKATILAGSTLYSGAPLLSTRACLRSGAGYTELCVPKTLFHAFLGREAEAILTEFSGIDALEFSEEKCAKLLKSDAIILGMGCGISLELYKIITYFLRNYQGRLLLDADALNTLSKYGKEILKEKKCSVVLTPHVKEFARLIGKDVKDVLLNCVTLAKEFAKEYNVVLALKNCTTIITDGEETFINVTGNACLAKGGSGDCLSGVIGSLLAQKKDLLKSVCGGVYITGMTAELCAKEKGEYSVIASDVIEKLPQAILSVAE